MPDGQQSTSILLKEWACNQNRCDTSHWLTLQAGMWVTRDVGHESRVFFSWAFRPQNEPKTYPKQFQNDPKTISKRFQNHPKTIPKQSQNNPKTIPQRPQNDPKPSKTTPKQSQNESKPIPKRSQNDSKTTPKGGFEYLLRSFWDSFLFFPMTLSFKYARQIYY